MITPTDSERTVPVFQAISRTQHAAADTYCIIAMADHARLAGELAYAFDRRAIPALTDETLQGIAIHDSGWATEEGAAPNPTLPPLDENGRPLSFLGMPPVTILKAWTQSIECASQIGPAAGDIVSRHFTQLGGFRLKQGGDTPDDVQRIQTFLGRETERQRALELSGGFTAEDVTPALDVLRLCDLLSLYFCCCVFESTEFPIDLGHGRVRVRRDGQAAIIENAPLTRTASGTCPGFYWRPQTGAPLESMSLHAELHPTQVTMRNSV